MVEKKKYIGSFRERTFFFLLRKRQVYLEELHIRGGGQGLGITHAMVLRNNLLADAVTDVIG